MAWGLWDVEGGMAADLAQADRRIRRVLAKVAAPERDPAPVLIEDLDAASDAESFDIIDNTFGTPS